MKNTLKNTIRTIIAISHANPAFARLAITIDVCIGLAIGTAAYLVMNATDVAATSYVVLIAGTIMFVAGMTVMGYTLMFNAMAEDRDFIDTKFPDIEFDDDDREGSL